MAFGLKISTFPYLLILLYPCHRSCCIYYGLVADMWHLKSGSVSLAYIRSMRFFKSEECSHRSIGIKLVLLLFLLLFIVIICQVASKLDHQVQNS